MHRFCQQLPILCTLALSVHGLPLTQLLSLLWISIGSGSWKWPTSLLRHYLLYSHMVRIVQECNGLCLVSTGKEETGKPRRTRPGHNTICYSCVFLVCSLQETCLYINHLMRILWKIYNYKTYPDKRRVLDIVPLLCCHHWLDGVAAKSPSYLPPLIHLSLMHIQPHIVNC